MKGAGEVYGGYLLTELEREHKRRESVDTRATATITGSAAVLTLTGVVAASTTKASGGPLADQAGVRLFATAFLLAVLLAILAVLPRRTASTDLEILEQMARRVGVDDEAGALQTCASMRVESLEGVRQANRTKVLLLYLAQLLQFAGVIALAVSLGLLDVTPLG